MQRGETMPVSSITVIKHSAGARQRVVAEIEYVLMIVGFILTGRLPSFAT